MVVPCILYNEQREYLSCADIITWLEVTEMLQGLLINAREAESLWLRSSLSLQSRKFCIASLKNTTCTLYILLSTLYVCLSRSLQCTITDSSISAKFSSIYNLIFRNPDKVPWLWEVMCGCKQWENKKNKVIKKKKYLDLTKTLIFYK